MSSGYMKLKSYSDNKFVFNVCHMIDAKTSLDQDMVLEFVNGRWIASIAFDDFPPQDTPSLAVGKLSKWLATLSKACDAESIKALDLERLTNTINF